MPLLINYGCCPLDAPHDARLHDVVKRARTELAADGCAVLPGFLSSAGLDQLLGECHARRPQAYFSPSTATNVYFSSDDTELPPEHPRRLFLERSNGFGMSDLFGENTGTVDRLLLIMSFADQPCMIGSAHRSRELYGKITTAHLAADCRRVRCDSPLD